VDATYILQFYVHHTYMDGYCVKRVVVTTNKVFYIVLSRNEKNIGAWV